MKHRYRHAVTVCDGTSPSWTHYVQREKPNAYDDALSSRRFELRFDAQQSIVLRQSLAADDGADFDVIGR